MSLLTKNIDSIKNNFSGCDHQSQRNKLLLSYGVHSGASCGSEFRQEALIDGCLSKTWVDCQLSEGQFIMKAYSESKLMHGMLGVMATAFNGAQASEITAVDMSFLQKTGVGQLLSSSRRSGLHHVLKRIQDTC